MPLAVHGDSEAALVTQCVRSRSSDAWRHPAHGKVPATETLQKRQGPFCSVGFDGFWLCSFGFRPVSEKTKPSHMPLGASRLTFASNGLNGPGARVPAMSVTPTNTSPFIEGAKPSSVTISWGAFYGQLALCLVG